MRAGLGMQAAMDEINDGLAADIERRLHAPRRDQHRRGARRPGRRRLHGDRRPVNVAARLQAAAEPGSVTVGEITHRLTRGAIEYVELEPLS